MESQIHALDAEVVRIEGLFASPEFHRNHATQAGELRSELAAVKKKTEQLYSRWAELESIKSLEKK